jgi:predicted DNA-binding transcriptional regulator YafY
MAQRATAFAEPQLALVKHVATHFEVGVRTAYRDLDFLRDQLRTPIEYDRSRGSFVLTDPTAPLPAVMLDHKRRAVRDFALHRIRKASLTDEASQSALTPSFWQRGD